MSNTPTPQPVTFATSAGVFGSFDAVAEADLPQEGKPNVQFPWLIIGRCWEERGPP